VGFIYFCRIIILRATGRLTLAPECVSVATIPDAKRTILVWCGIRTAPYMVWTVPGVGWGAGNRRENVLNCWGPMTSADAPTKLNIYINVIRRRRLSYIYYYYTKFPRTLQQCITIDSNIIMLSFVFYFRYSASVIVI